MNKSVINKIENGNYKSLLSVIKELWFYISNRRKKQLTLVLFTMFFAAIAELVSIGAVIPFLQIISNPEESFSKPFIELLAKLLNIQYPQDLIIPATILFCFAIVFAAFIRLLNLALLLHISAAISSDLSCESYKHTLYQPYQYHLLTNTSVVLNSSTTQIKETNLLISSCLIFITSTLITIFIYLGLILLNWKIAIFSALIFGLAYSMLALSLKKKLSNNSHLIANLGEKQIKAMQEGLGAIRDILLQGNQRAYIKQYKSTDFQMRLKSSESSFLSTFPRYAFEALGMLLIASLALTSSRNESEQTIILLGTFALAAQRILPAIQQIYGSWALIQSSKSSADKVLQIIRLDISKDQIRNVKSKYLFSSSIKIENVSFKYGNENPEILKNINLNVNKGEKIGLIGKTGSGKSTLIDILIGLLKPTKGKIFIDNKELHSANSERSNFLTDWRSRIAYVPQSIFLSDSTILENIAFGQEKDKIDFELVKISAEIAQISLFIESLPDKYLTLIGERGARLSGGQRQRIGIARALYKRSDILVLDEATSALDHNTELALMDSLENIEVEKTIFMIAHRLSTLKNCDRVFEISSGELNIKNLF